MSEMKKSCSATYFDRFKMCLANELGDADVDDEFSTKWLKIEKAMHSAINKDQNTERLSNFLSKNFKSFQGSPMEILIANVGTWVDSILGTHHSDVKDSKNRTISTYTFSTMWKYTLIFNIANNLSGEHKQMKEIITKQVTKMFDDKKLLLDITDFRTTIIAELEKKGVLSNYRNDIIPAPKKGFSVNGAKVEKRNDKNFKEII